MEHGRLDLTLALFAKKAEKMILLKKNLLQIVKLKSEKRNKQLKSISSGGKQLKDKMCSKSCLETACLVVTSAEKKREEIH